MHKKNALKHMQACIVHACVHIKAMSITDEITAFEERAKADGLQIGDVLKAAGVDRSTWTRWKNGTTKPLLDKWRAVENAAAAMRLKVAS